MNNIEPEDAFAGLVGGMMYGPELESGSLKETPRFTTGTDMEGIQKEVERVVDYLKKTVFPLVGV